MKGTSHLGIGQEAVAAGFAAALEPEDMVFCTYRGHVHTLLRGAPMAALMAELLGRATGICGGKGGSMHLTDVSHGAMGSYAIVGAHMPIAAGAAWAAKARGTGQVAVCFFGDGTTNIGTFHEALNLAAVWQLPVVFVCENNLYMEYTAIGDVTAVEHPAADRAAAYGLEPILIDGNDADVVHATAVRTVARARSGDGPSLVEAVTYRHGGHSRADPGKYRPDEEVAEWLGRDPIPSYRERLLAAGADEGTLDDIDREVARGVDRCDGGGAGGAVPRSGHARDRALGRRRLRVAELTYREAVARAIAQEMERDASVYFIGEDVAAAGGVFKTTEGLVRALRARAGPRHADQRAGDHRRRDGGGDERPPSDRRADVQRLLRRVLGHRGEPDREGPVHDERAGGAADRDPHGERRRRAVRRPALAERRDVDDGDPRAEGRRPVDAGRHDRTVRRRRARPRPGDRGRAEGAVRVEG